MSLTRGLGNLLIRTAFRILIGPGNTDLLSGYRAFSRRYRTTVELRSAGFEIETELASEAVARRLRVLESRSPTARGSPAREQAPRLSRRLADPRTIVIQSLRLRPWRPLALLAGAAGALALIGSLT